MVAWTGSAPGASSHWPPQHTIDLDALLDVEVLFDLRVGDENLPPAQRMFYAHLLGCRRCRPQTLGGSRAFLI